MVSCGPNRSQNSDLEDAKLEELLPIYKKRLKAWWEAKNAGQVRQRFFDPENGIVRPLARSFDPGTG